MVTGTIFSCPRILCSLQYLDFQHCPVAELVPVSRHAMSVAQCKMAVPVFLNNSDLSVAVTWYVSELKSRM